MIRDKDHMVTVVLSVPSRITYQLFKKQGAFYLTHFQPMYHLSANQVVGFTSKMCEKTPVQERRLT